MYNRQNKSEHILINILDIFWTFCLDKNFKFKNWIRVFEILFIYIFFLFFFPIIILLFFQNKGFYIEAHNWSMLKIIIIGLLLTLLIDFIIVHICILIVLFMKIIVFILKIRQKFLTYFFKKVQWPLFMMIFKESYPSVIFTMFLFSLIIWLRLIRERLPRDLNQTFEFGIQTIIVGLITIYFFILTIFYLTTIIKKSKKESKFYLFLLEKQKSYSKTYIYYFISYHLLNGPKNTFELIYLTIEIRSFFDVVEFFLLKFFLRKEKYFYIFFCLLKLSIVAIFFIDVVFYKQIIYFYKVVFLLLLPLVFDILLYMTKEHAIRSLNSISNRIGVSITLTSEKLNLSDEFETVTINDLNFSFNKVLFNKSDFDFISLGKDWWHCQKIYSYYKNFEQCKKNYDKFFCCLYFFFYFSSFFFYFLITINCY